MVKSNHTKYQLTLEEKNNALINGVITNIASAFVIAIIAFYPLFVGPRNHFGMTYNKTLFFWIAAGVAVVALTFMFICVKEKFRTDNYHIENEPQRRVSLAEWALLVFIAWALLSAILSVLQNPEWAHNGFGGASVWFGANGRHEGFITLLCYAAAFGITARFYKLKGIHLQLLAISTALVSLISILQFFGHDIFGLVSATEQHGVMSAGSRTTIGNVNLVSAYCSFAIPLFAALFTVSRSKWQYLYLGAGACSFALSLTTGFSGDSHKIALLGSMILLIPYWLSDRERLGRILITLSSWCFVYTGYSAYMSAMKRQVEAGAVFHQSDEYLLSMHSPQNITLLLIISVALLGIGLALVLFLKKWAAKPMKIAGIALLPVILVSGLAGLEIIGSRLSERPDNIIWQAREMMHGRIDDEFGTYRGWIWRNAVEVIPANPVFGTGPDTFFHALGEERQAESAERYRLMHDRAHNAFLQIAVCMGIPALIAYLIFLGSIFIPAIKRAFERPVLFVFGATALSYVIQSLFSIEGPVVSPLLWVALGVMAGELWQAKIGYKSAEII